MRQWSNTIISAVPSSLSKILSEPIQHLRDALALLVSAYAPPIAPLLPRAALFLFSNIASSLYLLEHALWAVSTKEGSAETDVEVFMRWVEEGGMKESVAEVARIMNEDRHGQAAKRVQSDRKIVFGATEEARVDIAPKTSSLPAVSAHL